MNGSHVALGDGRILRCGHFALAFCEWLRIISEDEYIGGGLTNTSSVLNLYKRLMPERAQSHINEIERRHDRTFNRERPVFGQCEGELPRVGRKRRLQYE